jgi:hypothetical protein
MPHLRSTALVYLTPKFKVINRQLYFSSHN